MTTQLCPLCLKDAVFETVHNPYGKRFTCSQCAEFFIDPHSEAHIASLPEVMKSEIRQKLSDKAKSSKPDQLFVIREPRNEELGGDGHQVARTQMIAEWVNREI